MTSGPMPEIPSERLAAAAAAVPRGRDSLLGFADAMDDFSQQAPTAPADVELHLVTFHLGAEEFGIPIETVREIVRVGDITRVPQAPPHVKGITNLRGRIVPIVSIKTRMGLPDTPLTVRSRCVLVEVHGRLLGLLGRRGPAARRDHDRRDRLHHRRRPHGQPAHHSAAAREGPAPGRQR